MLTRKRTRWMTRAAASQRAAYWLGLGLLVAVAVPCEEAAAQRPFSVYDPFYRSETARRVFFDGIAVTGEISYRAAGSLQANGLRTTRPDPFGLSAHIGYQLTPHMDLSAYLDAAGTNTGRTIRVSWVGLKYYWTVDNTDYAFRLAVDPASDGRVGFPQMDVAFLSTKALSPVFTNDVAIGVRHIRKGYQQFVPADQTADSTPDFINTRALGLELHFMWTYDVIFDPASSNIFLSLLGEGGQYSLVESAFSGMYPPADTSGGAEEETLGEMNYRGGVVWIRSGIEYNRPSYQLIPFLSIPLKQWAPEESHEARMQLGVRLMLR